MKIKRLMLAAAIAGVCALGSMSANAFWGWNPFNWGGPWNDGPWYGSPYGYPYGGYGYPYGGYAAPYGGYGYPYGGYAAPYGGYGYPYGGYAAPYGWGAPGYAYPGYPNPATVTPDAPAAK